MSDEYIEKTGRKAAQTNLNPSETKMLVRLRGELQTSNDADTIRQVLRQKWQVLGWIK
jgi:hypothetical protein